MTKTTRMELVEGCYKAAMALVLADVNRLPEGSISITPMVLGLIDRMLPPDYGHLTAAGVEAIARSEAEQ